MRGAAGVRRADMVHTMQISNQDTCTVTVRGARDDRQRLGVLLGGDTRTDDGTLVACTTAVRRVDDVCALSARAPEAVIALLVEEEDEVRLVVAVAGAVTYRAVVDRDLPGAPEEIIMLQQLAGIG